MDRKQLFTEYIKPIAVLGIICLVVSALLAFTNGKTAPIIEAAELEAAQRARSELIPEATGFTEISYPDARHVKSVFKSDNGAGFVITAVSGGYGGDVTATVAVKDGTVIGVKIGAPDETVNVGSRVAETEFSERFIGAESAGDVDTLSGATISSAAAKTAVDYALEAYAAIESGASAGSEVSE